jgi:Trypsin-like peptidase domain
VLFCLLLWERGQAGSKDAVIRIPSHGASGTVVLTTRGRSLILGCAHMFAGEMARKPLVFDVPSPSPGGPRQVGTRVLAIDDRADLSLMELNAGPLNYVCPVAPAGFRPGTCLSVGYDEMRLPAQARLAHVVESGSQMTYTREKPWHGRSGGALIDEQSGYLVGVVLGYEGQPNGRGIYVSHAAVLSFLGRHRGRSQEPQLAQPRLEYRLRPPQVAPLGLCPGGT